MKIAGHSTITVSTKYVHSSPEALERAFEKLEASNAEGRCTGRAHESIERKRVEPEVLDKIA